MDLGRLAELIDLLAAEQKGVSLMPTQRGMPAGGFGSDSMYEIDGWAVGIFSVVGGEDIAVAATIAEAVDEALGVLSGTPA